MFKILVLQALYSLPDEATEFQIEDRLSFQRFIGLGLRSALGGRARVRGAEAPHGRLFLRTIGMASARIKIGMANLAYTFQRLIWLERRTAPA